MTQWGSTFKMLIQFLFLQKVMELFVEIYKNVKIKLLKMCSIKWKYIKYIITLLYLFYHYIKALSTTSGPIIYLIWWVYNNLFQHLENRLKKVKLKPKWKESLIIIINEAIKKFGKYYEKTWNIKKELYIIIIILNLSF